MKEKILLRLIYTAGFCAAAIFLVAKIEPLASFAVGDPYKYGDLFMFCKVSNFKTELPPVVSPVLPSTQDSSESLYFFGDSFSIADRGCPNLPAQVSISLNRKIEHIVASQVDFNFFYPTVYFEAMNTGNDKKKVVFLEMAERNISGFYSKLPASSSKNTQKLGLVAALRPKLKNLYERWFIGEDKNIEFLVKNSILLRGAVEFMNTRRFEYFEQIAPEISSYTLNPPFLFFAEEADKNLKTSFYAEHSDSLICQLAVNIAAQQQQLQSKYNARLIFIPIPNKYTIYHRLVTSAHYDGFLPRLSAELKKRHVETIELYDTFLSSEELLYFPSDTHWNKKGIEICRDLILRHLKQPLGCK